MLVAFIYYIFISQTLTVLLTEPAATNLDLGENKQQLMDDGSSCAEW
jgi:hypothetical protein